ncbi:MAG: S1 RNA-binding domain-containing protein, partial [Spirosomataceae bacterium]
PDMMAHRLLQHYLDGKKSPATADYDEKCKHSSDQEKLAAEAERASIKYKQVEYMSLQDRKVVYEGVITGVTDFGIFVEIDGTGCEGMVSLRDMNDDYYEYDPNNYRLIGQRNGLIINFGDSVKVSIKETNLQDRSIDLTMEAIGDKVIEKGSPRKGKGGGGGRPSSRKPRKNNPQPRGKSKGKRKKR